MTRTLTTHAKLMREAFLKQYSGRRCTCAFGLTCSICSHVGNPANQDKDDSCWINVPDPKSDLVNDDTYRKRMRDW